MKRLRSRKNLCTKNFTYTKKFCVYKIAAVDLSKIYLVKNAKNTCKPNNGDLNRDWMNYYKSKILPSTKDSALNSFCTILDRVFSGPYFPVFDLNTESYSIKLRTQLEYGKIKIPYLDTFHAVHHSAEFAAKC